MNSTIRITKEFDDDLSTENESRSSNVRIREQKDAKIVNGSNIILYMNKRHVKNRAKKSLSISQEKNLSLKNSNENDINEELRENGRNNRINRPKNKLLRVPVSLKKSERRLKELKEEKLNASFLHKTVKKMKTIKKRRSAPYVYRYYKEDNSYVEFPVFKESQLNLNKFEKDIKNLVINEAEEDYATDEHVLEKDQKFCVKEINDGLIEMKNKREEVLVNYNRFLPYNKSKWKILINNTDKYLDFNAQKTQKQRSTKKIILRTNSNSFTD